MIKRILIAISVLIGIGLIIIGNLRQRKHYLTVDVEPVEKGRITRTVAVYGKILPRTMAKISSDLNGRIEDITVKEGDTVKKGELLAQINKEWHIASLDKAQSNLKSAELELEIAQLQKEQSERTVKRLHELVSNQFEAKLKLEDAASDYEIKQIQHRSAIERNNQARAALRQARNDLLKTEIFAPFNGTVIQINKEIGEMTTGSQFQEDVIMILADTDTMELIAKIDENDVVLTHVGDTAKIFLDAFPDSIYWGFVDHIRNFSSSPRLGVNEGSSDFEAKIVLTTKPADIRPNMTAYAEILAETHGHAIVIPIQCVTTREGTEKKKESVVFVAIGDSAVQKPVKMGLNSDTHYEILQGLDVGEHVITGDYEAIHTRLKQGMLIKVKPTEMEKTL